jgi:hypothetical protein
MISGAIVTVNALLYGVNLVICVRISTFQPTYVAMM